MVAYTYKPQFEAPTLALTKIGTIRAEGKKRHARPGETLQHYTGSRFRPRLFARSVCMSVDYVRLFIHSGFVEVGHGDSGGYGITDAAALDAFAVGDGFAGWDSLCAFWHATHDLRRLGPWVGLWIRWSPDSVVGAP